MVLLTPEALNALVLVVPGVLVTVLGAGLCMAKSKLFYVLVLAGSGWCSLVLWNYIQEVIEVSEVSGPVRGMMLALPVIFFVLLNVGVVASVTGKSENDREKM